MPSKAIAAPSAAMAAELFEAEIVPVVVHGRQQERSRSSTGRRAAADTSLDALAALQPAFETSGPAIGRAP